MKKILILISFLIPVLAFAGNVTLTPSGGTFSKTSMGTLTAGDTIFITTGAHYTAGTLSNISGALADSVVVIAVNYQNGDRFYVDGTLSLDNCNYIKVMYMSGNTSSNHVNMVPNNTAGHINQNSRFTKCYWTGTGAVFNTFNSRNWTSGNDATWTMFHIQIDSSWAEGTGPMTRGGFGHPANEQDMEYGTTIANCVFKNPTDDGEFVIGIVGGFSYHDNWIIYTSSSYTDIHDIGAFQLGGGSCAGRANGCGGGDIYNNHFIGNGFGRGWFGRFNVFTFDGHNDSLRVFNNYKTGTVQFGFAQIQSIDCDTAVGKRHAASTNIDNNFFGNADNVENGFESVLAYVGPYLNNHLRIRNNGVFNSDLAGAPIIHKVAGSWTPAAGDSSNNRYYSSAAALLLDTTGTFKTFKPKVGSVVIDAGITVSTTTPDILRVTRPKGSAYDIGPYEYDPNPATGCNGCGIYKRIRAQ